MRRWGPLGAAGRQGVTDASMAVPSDGFALTRGEPATGGLYGLHRQLYCPHCKSWMFTRTRASTSSSMSAPPCWTNDWVVQIRPTHVRFSRSNGAKADVAEGLRSARGLNRSRFEVDPSYSRIIFRSSPN